MNATDIKGAIRGEPRLWPSALFLDEKGKPFELTEPWILKLSGDERRLKLLFETELGVPLVPSHQAFVSSLKSDMATYLEALEHDGSPSDIGYTQRFDYSRQYQHEAVAAAIYKRFQVKEILPDIEETCPELGEYNGSQYGHVSQNDQRKRFFCHNPYLPRAIFEFAQHAIAGYDQPFRAELQRRARHGGYDRS